VTFRRPQWVAGALVSLADQERRLDRLVIVDNAHDPDTNRSRAKTPPRLIDSSAWQWPRIVDTTGGVEAGIRHTVSGADDAHWIVVLDDDDPPRGPGVLRELETSEPTWPIAIR
jgi:GT2 family glycosyltransferase